MFKLSSSSLGKLALVKPELAAVVKLAIDLTTLDFTVVEGLRTVARQKQLLKQGFTKTMNSRHLTGHAVDLAPWEDGKIDWQDEKAFHEIAEAVRKAAIQLSTSVTWGRAWSGALNSYDSAEAGYKAYLADCKVKGKKPFLDGPHFQLSWSK